MIKRFVQLTQRLCYLLLRGPRGYGKPYPKDVWDTQYREGKWDHLYDSLDELPRNMVIVGYIAYLHKSPAILDVGCGRGRLLDLLRPFGFGSYLGIDLSSEAIKAVKQANGKVQCEVADLERWEGPERFNIIVFGDSLYYALRPVDVLRRYTKFLSEDGLIIISIYRSGFRRAIWRSLDEWVSVVHSTTIKNHKGQIVDIRVVRPTSA